MPTKAEELVTWVEARLGKPYLWRGRGKWMTPPPGYQRGSGEELVIPGGYLIPSPYEGWDCFGLLADGMQAVGGPDLRAWWTDMAFGDLAKFPPVATPLIGLSVAFWAPELPAGPGDVEHVELVVGRATSSPVVVEPNHKPLPGWRTIGASGGGSRTTSLEAAKAQGACVRYREHHLLRPRFAGFRRLPL